MALHHGSVGIIRSVGRMDVPVYAIVEDRFTPAAVSRYLPGAFLWDTHGLKARRFAGERRPGLPHKAFINRFSLSPPAGGW
jgi:hypothetical protein